jgi:hypothetical protein
MSLFTWPNSRRSSFRPPQCRTRLDIELLERRDTPSVLSDFNNDGFDDLAIGAPFARSDSEGTGAVHVMYGTSAGLVSTNSQVFTNTTGIDTGGLGFGAALAAGNFNDDAFGDLAIGVPGATVNGNIRAGLVIVLFGSAGGLTWEGAQTLIQDQGVPEVGDRFGTALTAINYDGDNDADLVVGSPFEDAGPLLRDAGAVNLFLSSPAGLTPFAFWTQDSGTIPDSAEALDNFGASLAAGYSTATGQAFLAIGVPGEILHGGDFAEGGVHVIRELSLLPSGDFFALDSPGIAGASGGLDFFGASLTTGDFDGDGFGDLAVGAPGEILGLHNSAGAVHVLFNSGLQPDRNQFWTQNSYGVLDAVETGDGFGGALATGDFNADGRDDLAIGVPGEDIGIRADAGAINVLYGATGGLTSARNQFWHQNVPLIADTAEAGDKFGLSLAVGDFNGDNRADLAIGAPGESFATTTSHEGAVHVLHGDKSRLTASNSQFWTQSSLEVESGFGDRFGQVLGAGFSARGSGQGPLSAESVGYNGAVPRLTHQQIQLLIAVATRRWRQLGADTSILRGIDFRITNLGNTTLGLASGHTIWLDNNAAGWGWFVDRTPWRDSELIRRGNQGEQNRMDLLTVLEHEIGHLLGYDHESDSLMAETLAAGTRPSFPETVE